MLQRKSKVMLLITLSAALFASACAGPRAVVKITSRGDQVKLVYYQKKFGGYNQGILTCKAAENGDLSDCKKLNVKFKED